MACRRCRIRSIDSVIAAHTTKIDLRSRFFSSLLVPLHRGFDRLDLSLQHGQVLGRDENLDAAWDAGLPPNEPRAFEGEDHLMDRRRGYAEVPLELPFGRRPAMDARVRVEERQILALPGREGGVGTA